MKVLHEDKGNKGEFYVEVDGSRAALMTYSWAGTDKIIIEHI